MPVNVMQLLDDLEARLERAQRLIHVLEAQNRQLTQQLADNAIDSPDIDVRPSDNDVPTSTAADKPPTPHELLGQWYERYPLAFFKGHTKPLKVGIHQDLADREPWSNKLIRRALANYVNLPRYVKAMREGAERIDLEGNVAGIVDPKAAEFAANKRKPKESADANSTRNKKKRSEKTMPRKQAIGHKGKVERKVNLRDPVVSQKVSKPHADKSPEPVNQDSPLSMEEKLSNLQAKFRAQ
ncbi:ProQ/FINO family protein [Vreelandella aquamarina]